MAYVVPEVDSELNEGYQEPVHRVNPLLHHQLHGILLLVVPEITTVILPNNHPQPLYRPFLHLQIYLHEPGRVPGHNLEAKEPAIVLLLDAGKRYKRHLLTQKASPFLQFNRHPHITAGAFQVQQG